MKGLLHEFGFCGIKSLLTSLVAPLKAAIIVFFSSIASVGEFFFGISDLMLILLIVLIKIELITGLWAAYAKKDKIVSKKLVDLYEDIQKLHSFS